MGISWSTSALKSRKCLQTEDSEEDLEREIGLGANDELSEMMVPGQL